MFVPEMTDSYNYDENFIELSKYETKGKLPDPFLMEDGSYADTPEKWEKRRKEIYKSAVELQYGTIPPRPEVVEVSWVYGDGYGDHNMYIIKAGTKEKQVTYFMKVVRPSKRDDEAPYPVIVDGDLCLRPTFIMNQDVLDLVKRNNISMAMFDRTMLAHDIQGEGRRKGQLYDVYPEYTFGAIGAWAWGYMTCVDALEKIAIDDTDFIIFTGHSRGAKTAMLAGALDERAKIVAPNATCAGSCSCYRLSIESEEGGKGDHVRSETLSDMIKNFPFWFGEGMADYVDREEDLPFDSHFLKAMIAPRVFLDTEGANDIWANPVGSWMTTMGAKEVYKMLGVEDRIFWGFRKGFHAHKYEDFEMLVNVISHVRDGAPISERFFRTPFKQPELLFDWRAPEKK